MSKRSVLITLIVFGVILFVFFIYNKVFSDFAWNNKNAILDVANKIHEELKYKEAPQLIEKEIEVTFNAVGDIMLSRAVANQIAKNQYNANWPYQKLENELKHDVDFNIGNLESPYGGHDEFNPVDGLVFNAPSWTMPGLTEYNFKVLNLANNHAMDQRADGITHTKEILEKNQHITTGVGSNLDEAWAGEVLTVKDIRFGFIGASYASVNDNGVTENDLVARIEDYERLKKSIEDLKNRSDYIIVQMHAGTEYVRHPNQAQINFARAAIDAGADMVIGSHPHWTQTFEEYKGKPIFYSLGNFVFDQMWSRDTQEGLMLKIAVSKTVLCPQETSDSENNSDEANNGCQPSEKKPTRLKQIELIPVVIENYGQPRRANEEEKQSILQKIEATETVIVPQT